MIPSDWAIRDSIRSILAAADPAAVVLPKFVLDVMIGESGNLLKPEAGADAGKIHGWLIDRGKQSNKRIGEVRWDGFADTVPYRLQTQHEYRIWFFHYYALGDEGAGTDSARLFNERLDAAVEALAARPRLTLGDQIARHDELQIERDPDIAKMGDEWAHLAQCRLIVHLYRSSTA